MTSINRQHGITLIELMITLAILSIVAGIAIPAYTGYMKTGYRADCINEVGAIQLAEEEHFLENNTYFAGGDVATLQANSLGTYTPSADALAGLANCTYSVVGGGTGIANSYVVTATGANKLLGEGVILTKSN
jgi:type IV pilus assembly protein PilE